MDFGGAPKGIQGENRRLLCHHSADRQATHAFVRSPLCRLSRHIHPTVNQVELWLGNSQRGQALKMSLASHNDPMASIVMEIFLLPFCFPQAPRNIVAVGMA